MAWNEPPERRTGNLEIRRWSWSSGEPGRPGIPWVGVFLVALGALLLLDELVPAARIAGSAVFLAIGIAFLVDWALRRRLLALYAGVLICALALPGLLGNLGFIGGGGWTTLFLGGGFLVLAAIRWSATRAWGWQLWVGIVLGVIGLAEVGVGSLGQVGWPVVLVVLGLLLVFRELGLGGSRRIR